MVKLWLRSPAYFREIKGAAADGLEGIGSYELKEMHHIDVGDSTPIQPAFMMSFSAQAETTKKFGAHCIELKKPQELKQRVKDALPPYITEVTWQKVEYTKTMTIDYELGLSAGWNRKYFCKPIQFSDEQEWRLFILFTHRFRPFNNTLKIHVGNLKDIFKLKLQ